MIRFVDLKDQITEGIDSFAFYCTVSNKIVDFAGEHVFDDKAGFLEAFELETRRNALSPLQLESFINLIPDGYFRTEFAHIQTAKKLIAKFYEIMPVNDSKFTSNESKELTTRMEMIAAKQAAVIAVEEIIRTFSVSVSESEFFGKVLDELKKEDDKIMIVDNYKDTGYY